MQIPNDSEICLAGNASVFSVSYHNPLRRNGLKPTLDLTLESVFDQLCVLLLSALCACLKRFYFFFLVCFEGWEVAILGDEIKAVCSRRGERTERSA